MLDVSRRTVTRLVLAALVPALFLPTPVAASPIDAPLADLNAVQDATVADCLDDREQQTLDLINAYRGAHQLPPLTATRSLNRAAYLHSKDMGARGYISHVSPDGRTPWARMRQQGYGYNTQLGENIFGGGYGTPGEAFKTWKASPEHNANLLSRQFRAIGIGYQHAPSTQWTHYFTTDFGGVVDSLPTCR